MFEVYIAVNKINGKKYVGVTGRGINARRKTHELKALRGDNGCCKFYPAIRKNGTFSFRWRILARFRSKRKASLYEIEMIKKHKCEYNYAAGGMGNKKGTSHNAISILCLENGKIYKSYKLASKEMRIPTSSICSVVNGHSLSAKGKHFVLFKGRKYSRNIRFQMIRNIEERAFLKRRKVRGERKYSQNALYMNNKDSLGRSANGPMKNAKPVICLDDGNKFPSTVSAGAFYGIRPSAIGEICKGQINRRFKEYNFSYLKEVK